MDAPVEKKEWVWQPLTPRGAAGFSKAAPGRLILVQFAFALLAAAVVIWFVQSAWFRCVQQAIENLPRSGEIRLGRLQWEGPDYLRLAENRFLSLAVDLEHQGEVRSPAHLQIELGRTDVQVRSHVATAHSCLSAELPAEGTGTPAWARGEGFSKNGVSLQEPMSPRAVGLDAWCRS